VAPTAAEVDADSIYQRMLSESLANDPNEAGLRADLDWQSVWDRGWSVAAEAANVPVVAHTEHGLPVREPGARLIPGSASAERPDEADESGGQERSVTSNGEPSRPDPDTPERDPEAIRTSISSHFGGVQAARSHARENDVERRENDMEPRENDMEQSVDSDQGQNQP